jgi:hypothetical protein
LTEQVDKDCIVREEKSMRNKRAFVVSLTLIAVRFLISSAFASQLVDQTWLPGTVIRTTYGQYVDEVPRPGRANGANDLTITQSEFQ